MSTKSKIVSAFIVAVVICVALCWLSVRYNIGEFVGICGSIASLFGVWVAYVQIKSVKDISQDIQKALEDKISIVNNSLTFADISRILSLAKDAKTYVHSSNLEMASVRLSDLKLDLVLLRQNSRILESDEISKLNSSINDIGIDIFNIDTHNKDKEQITVDVIQSHLEDVLTFLADLEGKLKYKEL